MLLVGLLCFRLRVGLRRRSGTWGAEGGGGGGGRGGGGLINQGGGRMGVVCLCLVVARDLGGVGEINGRRERKGSCGCCM